ncbi:hypothetical protein C8035_v001180 [Colletotrichum spinosum]|uniref:Uncharacterized protein n=1 Tax=Colletotrichum spinosum TaxID=1347390 RepID=A0A4R8QTN4_9PEZI|nr:hypothetical protein C8035_v001180 [Colletotrichum spinosum]
MVNDTFDSFMILAMQKYQPSIALPKPSIWLVGVRARGIRSPSSPSHNPFRRLEIAEAMRNSVETRHVQLYNYYQVTCYAERPTRPTSESLLPDVAPTRRLAPVISTLREPVHSAVTTLTTVITTIKSGSLAAGSTTLTVLYQALEETRTLWVARNGDRYLSPRRVIAATLGFLLMVTSVFSLFQQSLPEIPHTYVLVHDCRSRSVYPPW